MHQELTRRAGVGPERWQHIEAIFGRAVELGGEVREGYLDRACRGDTALRQEVERLLGHDTAGSELFHDVVGETAHRVARADLAMVPERIGRYRLTGLLGEGGMGTVYRAEQEEPIRRVVAIKLTRPGMGSDQLRRFEAERQALALMQHPNIAQVFEAGWTEEQRPYFAMELVEGDHVTRYCDDRRLGVTERLELFVTVCRAVQHAHQKGVIHRDLKPSNILVTEEGGRPLPKVIDFGIAKAIDQRLTDHTLETGERVLGTPGYLSPEALHGTDGPCDVDTRSDIYSLGAVLYRLLLGVLPFAEEHFPRLIQRIVAEDPPSLWQRAIELDDATLGEHAKLRGCDPKTLKRALGGELGWIAARAIARQRSRRYASAAELADDIERFLRHEPVLAGPPSAGYRLRKLVRRHALAFSMAGVVLLALLAGLVARTVEARRANQEAARANQEAEAARQVSDFLVELFAATDPWQSSTTSGDPEPGRPGDTPVRVILERGAERIERELVEQPVVRARLMGLMAAVYTQLSDLEPARELATRSLELRRRHLGASHLEVAESLDKLAWLEDEEGSTRSEELFRQSLAIREQRVGGDHPLVATSLNGLGHALRQQGDYTGAAVHFGRALEIRRRHLAPDSPEVAESLNELGFNRMLEGELIVAEALFRESLAMRQRHYGSYHPTVARSLRDLGIVLMYRAQYELAETHLEEAVALCEGLFGESHPMVAGTIKQLGVCALGRGAFRQAETHFRRVVEMIDDGHPLKMSALNELALLLLATRRAEEAVVTFRRLLRFHRQRDDDDPMVALTLSNLGLALHATGELDEAESVLRKALDRYRLQAGAKNRGLGVAHHNLARLLVERGEVEEAEVLVRGALDIFARVFPEDHHPEGHWRRANSESVLGACLVRRGRHTQAEALLLPAAEHLLAVKGATSWYAHDALERIVELYAAWAEVEPEKAAKAEDYRQRLEAGRAALREAA